MATITVSDKSGLMNALNSADAGDKIVLKSGNYGSLSLKDYKFDGITIASADASKPAVFNMVNLTKVTNVTFDKIKFDYNSDSGTSKPFLFNGTQGITILNSEIDGMTSGGYGTGHGLWLKESSDFRIENTELRNFNKALAAFSMNDLQVIDNSFDGSAEDAMYFTQIDGVRIEGNSVKMKGKNDHRDMIQFGNDDANETSRDIVIRDNVLEAPENVTHGIYMGNKAGQTGDLDAFYQNVTIENNTIKSGQVLGIAVGEAEGVKISNNTVLQHSAVDSTKAVDIPVIRVDKDSKQVSITGNTTHKTPEAVESTNNWEPNNYKPSGWTISNNKIVPLGTNATATAALAVDEPSAPSPDEPSAPSLPAGDGEADEFRYNGRDIDGQERVVFNSVNLDDDDIILSNFDEGTFNHYGGGNVSGVNAEGTNLRINSLVDIQEVVTASKDVSAIFQTTNDTLVMRIVQDDGVLDIALPGFADAYKDSFNDNLF